VKLQASLRLQTQVTFTDEAQVQLNTVPILIALIAGSAATSFAARVPGPFAAQGSLQGIVRDATGQPLANVQVVIVEARRNAYTDETGRYRFVSLPEGSYVVVFQEVGYRPETRRTTVRGATTLDVTMVPVRIELAALQVTATADASGAAQSPQPVTIVAGNDLATAQQPTLGAVLEGLPGVRNLSTGQGIGKPVIRGLSGNRVLVLEDGVRLENAQWGDEHGPQVETLDAARIEVIRGPASVLYGSDAMGGVINIVPRELPDALGRAPFVMGRTTLGYSSGSLARDGGVLIEAARGALGMRASLVGRRADDVTTPAGSLFNSGLEATNVAAALGARGRWGHAALDVVHRTDRIEIHEDPAEDPGATPFQRVTENRVRADAGLPLGAHRLELKAGWERNRRREFEAHDDPAVALLLDTRTVTGEAHLHHAPWRGWNGVVGLSLMRQSAGIGGEETLVPASRSTDIGLLVFEQRDLGRAHLSAGLRFDTRSLSVDDNADLGVAAQSRRYNAVAGSLGAVLPVGAGISLAANVGRAWRAPNAFELFADGVHEGTVRYETGDSTLGTESSLNFDAALRWQTGEAHGEFGAFVNRIDRFIYAQPTGATDPVSGFQVFQHTQGDALLAGLEAALHVHPVRWLELTGQADWVYGQNRALDRPLPQMPPIRGSVTAKLMRRESRRVRHMYFSLTGTAVGAVSESRRDPDDAATAAYQVVHVGVGGQLLLGAQLLSLDAGIRNVFDAEYREFLSRYKTWANEMGRSIFVRLTAEF
jgi:iron complex outermembrane receptor protein